MKISRRAVVTALLVVLLFFGMILYSAPARLMQPILNMAVPQLGVSGLQGSFWRGTAAQSWVTHQNKRLSLGQLTWRLKPWSLLFFSPQIDVQLQGTGLEFSGNLTASATGYIGGENVSARVPLALFRTWYPLLLDGQLNLQFKRFGIRDNWLDELDGDAILESASWRMGRNSIALGAFQAEFSMEDEQLIAALRDRDAQLSVVGGATLAQDGRYSTNLYVERGNAAGTDVERIYRFMEFVGKLEGEGMRIKLNSRLPGMVGSL